MLFFILGCSPTIQTVTQTPQEMGTVVEVCWWSSERADGRVAFRSAGWKSAPAERVASDGGYRYCAVLLGLTSDTTHSGRIVLQADGEEREEIELELTAGRLDLVIPTVTLTEEAAAPAGLLLTSFLLAPSMVVILNEEGMPVWAVESADSELMISAARLHPAGGEVIFGSFKHDMTAHDSSDDTITWIGIDGSNRRTHPAPGLHHDLTVLPDGTVAYIASDFRSVEREMIKGDRIMELDAAGNVTQIWSAWDDLSYSATTPSSGGGWTHANALDYVPDDDAYLISLHNYNAILKIDRASGEILWTLGGPGSDFSLPKEAVFKRQHQFELLEDDRLLLFDNGSVAEGVSEIHELWLDQESMTVSREWGYRSDKEVYSLLFGDVQRRPSGNTMVSFCGAGLIEEVGPQGEVQWRMETEFGGLYGYTSAFEGPESFFAPP